MNGTRNAWVTLVLAGGLLTGSGCASLMRGSPSFTLLSRELNATSPNVQVIGEMDEATDTTTWCLIFWMSGKIIPSHEALIDRLLQKHQADLLVDADLTVCNYGIPYLFMQFNTTVRGRPAKLVSIHPGGVK